MSQIGSSLLQNNEKDYYKQSINNYFRQSEHARTLEEEKTFIGKILTNKTGNIIRKHIHDLFSEETEVESKNKLRNNDFCLALFDPDLEYLNAQELLDKKNNTNCAIQPNIINQINFRAVSKDD
ncbi:17886_t:CDS:2, partial [Cetraspora pellucida]